MNSKNLSGWDDLLSSTLNEDEDDEVGMNPLAALNEKLASQRLPAATYEYEHRGPDNNRFFKASCRLQKRTWSGQWEPTKKEAAKSCAVKILAELFRTYLEESSDEDSVDQALSEIISLSASQDLRRLPSTPRSSRVPRGPPSVPRRKGRVAIIDYENIPLDPEEVLPYVDEVYLVIGSTHHKLEKLEAEPASETTIIVQPSGLKDASDMMIVLLVGRIVEPTEVVVFTRDRFASLLKAIVNDGPYQLVDGVRTPLYQGVKVSVATSVAQLTSRV